MRLNYCGALGEPGGGYSAAGYHFCKAAKAAGIDVSIITGGLVLPPTAFPAWARDLHKDQTPFSTPGAPTIIHHLPHSVTPLATQRGYDLSKVIGYTTWETETLPAWLEKDLEQIAGVLVPSEFNLAGTGLSGVVVPHCANPEWGLCEVQREDPFTFYYVGNWNTRKNPEGVLKAYLKAFSERDGTRLILKLPGVLGLDRLVRSIIEAFGGGPRKDVVVITDSSWTEDDITWLHAIGDVFVSAHRGEGFGLGLFQAACMGNRVVATGFSAPLEFVPDELARWVCYETEDVTPQDHLHFMGSVLKWAKPSIVDMESALKSVYTEGRISRLLQVGLMDRYSWAEVGAGIDRAIHILLG